MSRAEKTRAILLDAALAAFSQRGVRATTLEHVAASANLSRGALYWHFSDRSALVLAVFEPLVWPLDIGSDIDAYRQSAHPLEMLRDSLERQMRHCLSDARQRRMMEVVIRYRGTADLPPALSARLGQMALQALQHLSAVINIAYARGQLKRALTPIDVAHCVSAACMGVITENMENPQASLERVFHLAPGLVLLGASAEG